MPDTDGFDPGLCRRDDAPARWTDAFAALPQESPAPAGWQRLQARLPVAAAVPARRARWPAWGALAASLALAAAIPLHLRPDPAAQGAATPIAATGAPSAAVAPGTPPAAAAPETSRLPASVAAGTTAAIRDATTPTATQGASPRATRRAPPRPSIRTLAPPAGTAMLASATPPLEALQNQSAQLEGLLALARDERVSSGTTAALTSELDARVASIDASLVQPDLDPAQRSALWSERVDALQQLVGIETTNRLYAARGETLDVALVSVD